MHFVPVRVKDVGVPVVAQPPLSVTVVGFTRGSSLADVRFVSAHEKSVLSQTKETLSDSAVASVLVLFSEDSALFVFRLEESVSRE